MRLTTYQLGLVIVNQIKDNMATYGFYEINDSMYSHYESVWPISSYKKQRRSRPLLHILH